MLINKLKNYKGVCRLLKNEALTGIILETELFVEWMSANPI